MLTQRFTSRAAMLAVPLAAGLVLAACGDDDTSDAATDESPADTSAESPTDVEGPNDDPTDSADGSAADGVITVDGVTYSFVPSLCLVDETAGSSVIGSGTAPDGTEVFVDMAAGNLSVYLGDDPMSSDPDYVASSVSGQGSLDETVEGSTLSADASFTEHASTDVVAEGSLEVSC